MIKRYPCQAVILFVLGILTAKGAALCRISGSLDTGVLLSVCSLAAALVFAGIWAGRERNRRRKICLALVLVSAYGTGMIRMHDASDALKCRTAGIADGQKVTVQGKIIKKQCKDNDTLYADEEKSFEIQENKQDLVEKADRDNKQVISVKKPKGQSEKYTKQSVSHISNLNSIHVNHTFMQRFNIYQHLVKISECRSFPTYLDRIVQTSDHNTVSEEPKQWTVYLTDTYLKIEAGIQFCGNVIVYLKGAEPVIGNTVILSGKSMLFQNARNDGNFDERAYYQNQGYSLKIYADDHSCQAADIWEDSVREVLYALQQKLLRVYSGAMPQQEAGALSAMLLGEKSLLLSQTKELYRQSGISHILAISGLHISILGASMFHLLRKRGVSYVYASVIAMGLLLMFVLMTGMGLSALRAVIMFGIYLGAACAGRAYDSVNGLAAAAVCILAYNPCALFLAGFQFSFAAVAGVLFGKEICRVFQPRLRLTETLMISAGIQILILPLTAWYYFEIPLYSMLLNLLVLPFVELVLITGLFGGGFGLMAAAGMELDAESLSAVFQWIQQFFHIPWLQRIFGMLSDGFLTVCAWLLRFFAKAGELFLELPGAVCVLGRPAEWQMVCYYMIAAGTARILVWASDQSNKQYSARFRSYKQCSMESKDHERCSPASKNHEKCSPASKDHEKCSPASKDYERCSSVSGEKSYIILQKRTIVICILSCLGLLFARLPKYQEVTLLDVGQGDGIYIHTSDGMDIFIDGGSTDVKNVGTYRILPFLKSRGVSDIDLWFVSHLDKDHVSGLKEVADSGYQIGQVVFAKGVVQDDAYDDLLDLLDSRQILVQHLGQEERLHGAHAVFTSLWPSDDTGTADDRNAASLALLYEDGGFRAFFSGDLSAEEEKKLLREQNITQVTLYKAAHHGSKYSNSLEILQLLKPDISVVSCAKDNDYGHPGKEAVKNMEKFGGSVYYTMQSGQIRICQNRRGIFVQEYDVEKKIYMP